MRFLCRSGGRRTRCPPPCGGCGDHGGGDHLHRVFRGGQHRPRLAVRRGAAHHPQGRMGPHRGRAQAAPEGAQSVHRRPLPRAEDRQGRRVSRRGAGRFEELSRGLRRRESAVRGVGAYLRHRSGARRRRHVLRAGRQPARAVRRVLHAGKPPADEAAVSGAVRALRHAAGGRLHRAALRHAGRAVAASRRASGDRGAHAGHLQLGLFRALVSGAADGRATWSRAPIWWCWTTTAST